MTISVIADAENSNGGGGIATLACSSSLTLATGDIVEFHVYAQTASTNLTISDGLGNSFVLQATSSSALVTGTFLYTFVAQNCASGTSTPQAVASSGPNILGVYAKQIRGGATSSAVIGSTTNVQIGGPGSGANAIVSGNVNIAVAQNVLVSGFTVNPQFQTPIATAGTSPLAFSGRTAVWSTLGSGTAYSVPEELRVVGASGNVQATFGTTGGGSQFDNFGTNCTVYAELAAAVAVADGTSSSSTTCTTGTGGQAIPAITIGQFLYVILAAQTALALTDNQPNWVGSSGGTFFAINTFAAGPSHGYVFDVFGCIVTANVAAPVIQTTWAGGTPTKAAIAVGIIPAGIVSGFVPGNSNANFQTTPSGANAQVSGNTPVLTAGAYLLIGAGFNTGLATAPVAGTGFTSLGTCWAGLGTGASLNIETQIVAASGAVTEQATFTPPGTNNGFTLVAALTGPVLMGQACL